MNLVQKMHVILQIFFNYKQIEYKNKKGKTKKKKDESAAPVLYVKLVYSDKSKKYFLYS